MQDRLSRIQSRAEKKRELVASTMEQADIRKLIARFSATALPAPTRARVCCAGRGTPSARETTIGQGFPSPYQPDKKSGARSAVPI